MFSPQNSYFSHGIRAGIETPEITQQPDKPINTHNRETTQSNKMEQWGQQSSEITNSSKLTNTLLNGRNYLSWARSVNLALSARDKLEFITGEKTKPKPTDPEKATEAEKLAIQKWQTTDHMVMTWLIGSMEPIISYLFLHSSSTTRTMGGCENPDFFFYHFLKKN